ncbi:hypothetical protein [Flavitalea flava]
MNKGIPVETHITWNWVDLKDVAEDFEISKARTELGFDLKDTVLTVKETMLYLQVHKKA